MRSSASRAAFGAEVQDTLLVAVKELRLSYYNPETMLSTIYPEYGILHYQVPEQKPSGWRTLCGMQFLLGFYRKHLDPAEQN